jgi:hypothetical protein
VITPKDIEENIGFSKDFNVFERKAIGERNQLKATPLLKTFKQSEREPMVVTTSLVLVLYNYSNTMDLKTKIRKMSQQLLESILIFKRI